MRAIIPCAGFGTRMSMAKNKSKEMLPDPQNKRKFIIDYSLHLCKVFNMEPLVITREDKQDLRQHLYNQQVEFIDITPRGEWYKTVLKSKEYWSEDNILILPDTRFNSIGVIDQIQQGLVLGNNAVFAMHKVSDPQNWGIIKDYRLWEKPIGLTNEQAWGIIGFKKEYGEELFDNMSGPGFELNNVGFVYLKSFKDITRGN